MKRRLKHLSIPLRDPFVTAGGVVNARELLLLELEDDRGVVGRGEAAPFEPYDGVPVGQVISALTRQRGRRPPQARAAEELARLDLEARQEERSVGEPGASAIPVNFTLAAGPADELAARAAAGLRAGYSTFKVKVGLPDDRERVRTVRAAIGSWPALRIDANGAWSVDEAVQSIRELEENDLQLVEQPCRTLDELAEVRERVSAPIAADEPIATADDVRAAVAVGACDAVSVKLATSGGFGPARDALRTAAELGLGAYLSSTLDGPWGIAAALRLAASERITMACGLATLELFDAAVARALPPPANGVLAVPDGPGFGVEVPAAAVSEVLVEELE